MSNDPKSDFLSLLDYLKNDLHFMREEISSLNRTLAQNTTQLELHIEGVRLAREQNQLMKTELDAQINAINQKIHPLQEHATKVNFLGKLGLLIFSPAAIYYILQIIKILENK